MCHAPFRLSRGGRSNTAFASSGGQNYALASTIAMIVFFLTLVVSLVNFRAAGVFEEARR